MGLFNLICIITKKGRIKTSCVKSASPLRKNICSRQEVVRKPRSFNTLGLLEVIRLQFGELCSDKYEDGITYWRGIR
jgi:hypothetical protein